MLTPVLVAYALVATAALELKAQPEQVRPGDAFLLNVAGASAPPTGEVAGRPLLFLPHESGYRAVVGLPVETPIGPLEVTVAAKAEDGAEQPLTTTLQIVDPGWRSRELKVAGKFIDPPPEVQARIEEDKKAFAEAQAQPPGEALFKSDFRWPRKAVVTAKFGDRRTFNGTTQSQHFGTDLDGAVGAPIYATNDGQVVMVRDAYTSGKTVIVHHGQNVFSLYFHLSKILVPNGTAVKKGQLLGRVGSTGRVTGPHLHWSMKVGDLYVDPESFLRIRFVASRPSPETKTPPAASRETSP